jgi:hypothetical protein
MQWTYLEALFFLTLSGCMIPAPIRGRQLLLALDLVPGA